jgi:hypothetical protein
MATVIKALPDTLTREQARDLRRTRIEQTFQLDPQVNITLKGKKYILELNNWAVKGILKQTTVNLMAAGDFGICQMQDPEVMGAILFWALASNQPDLTQDEVDKLYTFRHYPYILEKIKSALELFLPDMSDIQIEGARVQTEAAEDPQ